MRLIDADKIHPDVRTQRGALAISQGQLAYAPTVCDIDAIRAEIRSRSFLEHPRIGRVIREADVLQIIDKYTKGEQ